MYKPMLKSIKLYNQLFVIFLIILFSQSYMIASPWMGALTQVYYHKTVKKDKMKIAFKEIISDNRCPVGAQCITAGTVKVLLKIGNTKTEIQLGATTKIIYKNHNYQVQFVDMRPYREKEKEYNKEEAYLFLKIVEIKSTP